MPRCSSSTLPFPEAPAKKADCSGDTCAREGLTAGLGAGKSASAASDNALQLSPTTFQRVPCLFDCVQTECYRKM